MPRPRIQPGEDTTATSKVVAGKKPGYLSMQWRVCLWNGRVERHVTEVKTKRATDVRQRAKASAQALLSGATTGSWRRDSELSAYIERESIPAIERNEFTKPLRPHTQERYIHVLRLLSAQIKGLTIADAVRPRTLNDALVAIASANGTATAKQCSKVASKYVLRRLVTDEVIEHNPLRDMELELPVHVAKPKPRGGRALTPEERARVIDYLLAYEAEQIPQPKRGRYSAEQRTAIRERAVDVTLVQAETGLRINEACSITRADVDANANPLTVTVTAEVSKTHRGRTVPVMDDRVADRIRERLAQVSQEPTALVFGSPAFPDRVWDASNRQKAAKALYREMADSLGIPQLRDVATHAWRATLNSEWADLGISAERRAAYFGHSVDVNRARYTDLTDVSEIARMLRSQDVHQDVSIAVTQGDSQ